MNIRDLTYLVAIADHGHFGAAASACFVSQPALSMQIKKLETVLGVQLIERTNKSALLTEIGKTITQQAREILCQVAAIKETAKQAKDPYSGELHLGIIPTLAPYLLPYIVPNLSKLFPNLTIYLVEEQTTHLIEKLRQGKLDGALLGLPLVEEDLITLPLFKEEFLLAVPPTHRLAKRKVIGFSDLENEVLLLLKDGHCMRDLALEVCYKAKASESRGFQATSLETLRHMVASHVGITLMPTLAYKSNDGIHYLSFKSPKPSRIVGLAWRPSSAKKILLENIVGQIKKCISKHSAVSVIQTPIRCQKTAK